MPSDFSPEFRFVCAACRWPRGPERDAAVRDAAEGIDWSRAAAIARRQRVWGLVDDAIRSAGLEPPPEVATGFAQRGEANARRNLIALAATAQLGRAFDAAGIDWIGFKGLTLAVRAYGSLAVKMSNDIDLLVSEADTARACSLIAEAGYRRFNPGPEIADHQIEAWMKVCKETGWHHPQSGLIVELHGRMLANPALMPEAGLSAPRQRIVLAPGIDVPTLADEILLPYLFVHGAHHGWFRLKWLADVAAWLAREPELVEQRYEESRALGVGRAAAQAMLLAHKLLALPLDPAFEARLRADPVHRRLVAIALACMAGDFELTEHANPAARTMLPATLGALWLRRGLGYKWSELVSLASNPTDRATGKLPPGLGFLYPVLGGVRWGARMTGLIGREAKKAA
ncbi:nucleotidyltransferase family protein [Sphingomonas sp.]|uniref:nucleotidyltransferase domain-containing protein n=1 Tax=Sphingomonas sp. TaxID=28214 RepID=UPI0025EA88E5|nr:nucleotidyltransferase family protein [Sphingomonas sp.]